MIRRIETLQSVRSGAESELERELSALDPWFHNIHLPDGVQTAPRHPLGDFPAFKWREIEGHIPNDLSGWRVLDLGCNAGFYSFELARRGAFVDGVDVDPHYLRQARWAAERLGLSDRVNFRQAQVYDLAREPSRYDLVWFMGVFYHLRYPLLGLDILARKTRRQLVFQSLSIRGDAGFEPPENLAYDDRAELERPEWPRMAFIEQRFAGDATNWWVPDSAAVCAMLRAAGLEPREKVADETWLCQRVQGSHPPPAEYAALFPEKGS